MFLVKHLSYQTILAIEKFFYTKKLQRAKLNYQEKPERLNQIRLLQEEGNCGMFHVKHSVLLNKLGQTEDK